MTLSEVAAACKDAKEICEAVQRRIKWKCVRFGEVKYPFRRFKRPNMCYVIADCVFRMCMHKEIECEVVTYYNFTKKGKGHALAVGDGWFSSNGEYYEGSPDEYMKNLFGKFTFKRKY